MKPTKPEPQAGSEAAEEAAPTHVVKPRSSGRSGVGRSTLEDRDETIVRPVSSGTSAARSTFRDLHAV